jgi:hypothetical protein
LEIFCVGIDDDNSMNGSFMNGSFNSVGKSTSSSKSLPDKPLEMRGLPII